MENLNEHKVKISVLWLFYTIAFSIILILSIFEPGALEQIMNGEVGGMIITSELILGFALLMLIPLILAFLTLTLKDSINRVLNIIIGIFYICFQLFALGSTLIESSAVYTILLEITKVIIPVLIVWYAYKWPKANPIK